MDRYTNAVLTVIALALCVIAVRGLSPVPPAFASSGECTIEGPITISDFRDTLDVRITDNVEVKMSDSYPPGSSSTSPIYVQTVD